jgi:DNA-directed RNA polymerase specialized sigma24 family protein
MASCFYAPVALECDTSSSDSWDDLYRLLCSQVKVWVSSAHIPSWLGQEKDITEEIVQEAICRTFERVRKAEREEAEPVKSKEYLCKTIARHYFIDLIRKDSRIVHLTQINNASTDEYVIVDDLADPTEEVHDQLFQESLFDRLAPEIINFPKKQSQAIMSDLARHSHFDGPLTPLQRAFLRYGVCLQDYQRSRPDSAVERSRHASLVSLAYRRVSKLSSMKPYVM